MKYGATQTDQIQIAKMHALGVDLDMIAFALQLPVDVVKKFIPQKTATKASAKKAAPVASAPDSDKPWESSHEPKE